MVDLGDNCERKDEKRRQRREREKHNVYFDFLLSASPAIRRTF